MKKLLVLLSAVLILSLSGCQNSYRNELAEKSDTLYVKKLDLKEDFIKGVDISSIIALEKSGVEFYGYSGEKTDIFQTLAESGINYIRVRVWNHPFDKDGNGFGGGNNDINTAIEIGKRATKYNMKLLVDFHYSDFWADPGKQMVPLEWKGLEIDEKCDKLYEFTKECLNKLKEAKVDVGMIQVGNETNKKLCGEVNWSPIVKLMKAGSKACREVFPKARVAVHFANPENGSYPDYAFRLDYYQLDYDVFASSYYPFWHGTLDNLINQLDEVSDKYGKETMVVETSYAYTADDSDFFGNTIGDGGAFTKNYPFTVQGQANCIVDTMEAITKMKKGIGLFYWEPAWITVGGKNYEENLAIWEKYGSGWAASYARGYDPNDAGRYYGGSAVDNQALFDSTGHPLESLKLFNLVNKGNPVELKVDAVEDVNIMCDINGEIVLPDKVNAVMSDNSKQAVAVKWNNPDYETYRSGGVAKYVIEGEAGGLPAKCYLSMIEYNFLDNYSFESGELGKWQVIDHKKCDELYIEEKKTDSLTGDFHFHFWSKANDSIDFDLEQTVSDLKEGTYKYAISIMGSDGGQTDIYAYVKINDVIVKKASAGIDFYNVWHEARIEGIEVKAGDKVTVGIHVRCSGAGNGAWGKIDDALLNSQS
ncbi:MAG: glycosyl hydrolase 53 family protein [Erysipelotrichaceae bacterium]|nr:glycosyl hydrolase 53 family protein [Erysipelotrichaceae bacterium]